MPTKNMYNEHYNYMKNILTIAFILISNGCLYSQVTYKFDTSASVYGCSNILLQKISKDWRYELMIEISKIDSLPKSKAIDLMKYSKFITIYLNKYPKDNAYVHDICNDIIYANRKIDKPDKYEAKQGTIIISKWDSGEFIISLLLKNVILTDKLHKKIKLTSEQFHNMKVGWIGG